MHTCEPLICRITKWAEWAELRIEEYSIIDSTIIIVEPIVENETICEWAINGKSKSNGIMPANYKNYSAA